MTTLPMSADFGSSCDQAALDSDLSDEESIFIIARPYCRSPPCARVLCKDRKAIERKSKRRRKEVPVQRSPLCKFRVWIDYQLHNVLWSGER